MTRIYTCALCGGTFTTNEPLAAVIKRGIELELGNDPNEEYVEVCDNCWPTVLERIGELGL